MYMKTKKKKSVIKGRIQRKYRNDRAGKPSVLTISIITADEF